jgi:hypothetical protein
MGAADTHEHVAEAGNAAEQGTDLDYLDPLQRVCAGGLHWRKVGPRVGERGRRSTVNCGGKIRNGLWAMLTSKPGVDSSPSAMINTYC